MGVVDYSACTLLGLLVSSLGPGSHIYEYEYARVEVNRKPTFATVWLHLPGGRTVIAAFGDPGDRRAWRCTDPDALALALHVVEHGLGLDTDTLHVELTGEGATG